MGGSSYRRKPTREEILREAYSGLKAHPNFKFPEQIPERCAHPEDVIEWVCECAARLLSPPQEEGESNELECVEVATAVRRDLKLELIEKFRRQNR